MSGIFDMIHLKKQVASFLHEVSNSNATPAKLHVNINFHAVLKKGFAINGCANEGASSHPRNTPAANSPNSSWLIPQLQFIHFISLLGSTIPTLPGYPAIKFLQAAFQFFRGFYPPWASGVSRCSSLKRVTCHLFRYTLLLSRDPILANVYLPHLSTGGTPFCIRLLRFEVFFRSRSRRGFHFE